MKNLILTSAAVLFIGFTSFAQEFAYTKKWDLNDNKKDVISTKELEFSLKGRYTRSVAKEKLNSAKLLSDIIQGYPTNWIIDYVSAEISATCNGKVMKAMSANEVLTTEQKNILSTVDEGTGIIVNVKYKSKNPVLAETVDNEMYVEMMIVPEKEAEFVGGEQQMKKYLKEKVISKITETTPKQFQQGIVIFTVNEQGEIVNPKISQTSGDTKTDKLLLESINKMPKWNPAQNAKGLKIKQEFKFWVGTAGC